MWEIELKDFKGIDMPRLNRNLRDTRSIILKPGTAKNKFFPGYGTNFRYIGEVKNGLDRVTVVKSILILKYSDVQKRPIVFNNCTEELQ